MGVNRKLRTIAEELPNMPVLENGKPKLFPVTMIGFEANDKHVRDEIDNIAKKYGFESFYDAYNKRFKKLDGARWLYFIKEANQVDAIIREEPAIENQLNPPPKIKIELHVRTLQSHDVNHFDKLKEAYKEGGMEKVERYIKFVKQYVNKENERLNGKN